MAPILKVKRFKAGSDLPANVKQLFESCQRQTLYLIVENCDVQETKSFYIDKMVVN